MSKGATLRTVEDWSSAWRFGFLPWLRRATNRSMLDEGFTLVVAPDQPALRFARSMALESGVNAPAVHFVTPSQLRDLLSKALNVTKPHALRETLRLLLAAAAEQCEGDEATAVAAAPDSVLKTIDLLGSGGWSYSEMAPAALQPVLREFTRLREACGFALLHETDAELRVADRAESPVFSNLCVLGFDAAHWPAWPLLSTAVRLSEKAEVYLRLPSETATDLDSLWIGTWEQEFSPAEPLLDASERRGAPEQRIVVAEDVAEEARAVVQQALQFLADADCTRLAILFPGSGALARRVAAELNERGVPHFDGIGHSTPSDAQAEDWTAWIAFQENPRLPALLEFVRAYPRCAELFDGAGADRVIDALSGAFRRTLLDDFEVLAMFAQEHAGGLRAIPRLPATATLADFVSRTIEACKTLGWTTRAEELRRQTAGWADRVDVKLSLRLYVRWLREILTAPGRDRCPAGNHPYSRTHLLPASQAGAQAWSHLILAGLNQGDWPPAFNESGWITEAMIGELNGRVRTLNRRARRAGRQGEGHETIAPGKALCLGPAEKRLLALRDFRFAIEASQGVAFCACLMDESAPGRMSNPAEFLSRIYFDANKAPLSSRAMRALHAETARWLARCPLAPSDEPPFHSAVADAYRIRRDVSAAFGPYEFSLARPPSRLPRLNATDWERALSSPSLIWMKCFLGVRRSESVADETPWGAAIGEWVHRWLSRIAGDAAPKTFAPLPPRDELLARIRHSAAAFRERVAAAAPLPEWWHAIWAQAHQIARDLGGQVSRVDRRYTSLATEWRLPDDTTIEIDEDVRIGVRGRLDLVLAASPHDLWVVDYKTGKSDRLKVAKLVEGDGLQLALYALALEKGGVKEIALSRLTRELTLDEPQLTFSDVSPISLDLFWRGLAKMGSSGVFGSRGALRDEYSFADDHPLATLRIDQEVLEEKWNRTHPNLARNPQ